MKAEDREMVKIIDKSIISIKKKILQGTMKVDEETKNILEMLKMQINELSAIARIAKEE